MAIASSSSQHKYQVFISFRGEDTRSNFTSHLYHAFRSKKINAYIDEESLKKGDEISPALMRAIQESLISVVILSENYASSSWCLDELNHILQCKEINNQIVVPVFYGVSPSQVEKQQGSYGSAFAAHEDRFKDQMDKVQQWRDSLTEVANLEGWKSSHIGSNSKLVEVILKDILEKLHHMLPSDIDFKDLVGIEKRIQHVESLLNIDSLDVRIVGIWGMGGTGKTTLAHVIFNRFASQFEGFCFLENVKEESKRRGLTKLQKELFSKILLEKKSNLRMVKERLRQTKVFIVFDDVDDVEQFEYLVGGRDRFAGGSKIIVTTRDKQVLNNIGVDETYKVEELDFSESQGLFCSKAFPGSDPMTHYTNLFERVVQYSGGIPLALKVLGSHFQSKSKEEWESDLDKLETTPHNKVYNVLKISYDGLDSNEKEIFLDIAFFFNGEKEQCVKQVLDAYSDRFVDSGIRVLIDKSLITIETLKTTSLKTTSLRSVLKMHNLLQKMGWRIVRDECIEPGKRSRLRLAQDIFYVLKHKTGTGVVQGMSMYQWNKDVKQLDPLAFKELHNLKCIRFNGSLLYRHQYFEFPLGFEFLPDELRYIAWDNYPLKYLPSDYTPRNLVELHLRGSKLEHLWNYGVPNLKNLKVLDLSCSKNLIQIQDLSLAVNLEMINLYDCNSLESLPDLSLCANLKEINLSYCSSLKSLPSSIGELKSLKRIDLHGCEHLENVPGLSLCVNLEEINLSYCTRLKSLPNLSLCVNLKEIILEDCYILKSLPSSIGELKSLKRINLHGCEHLENVPDLSLCVNLEDINLSFCSSLKRIDLRGCEHLENVPDLSFCVNLEEINLEMCTSLKSLPDLSLFANLKKINLSYCSWLKSFPDLSLCANLKEINLSFCSGLKSLPSSIRELNSLKRIDLHGCEHLENVPNLCSCVNLEDINLSFCSSLKRIDLCGCKHLKNVPDLSFCVNLEEINLEMCTSLKSLPDLSLFANLKKINLSYCSRLKSLPDLSLYANLKEIILEDCYSLKSLPSSIGELKSLKSIDLRGCKHLKNVPNLSLCVNLEEINLERCTSLKSLSDLSLSANLKKINLSYCSCLKSLPNLSLCANLEEINISFCSSLKSLPSSIGELKSLKSIDLRGCKHLENVPDLSLCVNLEEINLMVCPSLKSLSDLTLCENLKKIDLLYCSCLKSLPDLSLCANLKEINLSHCSSLESLLDLSLCANLKEINLSHCSSLESLPDLSLCANLEKINLSHCSSLKSLPDLSLCANLEKINLSHCSSLENLPNVPVNIQLLDLRQCTRLKRFPICKLKSLVTLDLRDCSELEYLPDIWEPMERLRNLHLNGSGIKGLPSIKNLIQISGLYLNDCKNLCSVPHSIYHMPIKQLDFSGCSNLQNFSFLTSLPPSLWNLNLSHTCLSEIPDCIFSLPKLNSLSVAGTMISSIPESIKSSKSLYYLDIRCCDSIRFLPELPLCIEKIDASGCTSLEMFSKTSIDALTEDPRVIRRGFYFLDCLKLDYNCIITEFKAIALCLAAAANKGDDDYEPNNYDYYDYDDSEVDVCYTGDEIPKWFNHQNNGSRVNVTLSPHDLDFMGSFAASVVVARGDAYEEEIQELEDDLDRTLVVLCDTCFRTNEGERHLQCRWGFYKYKNNHISNHMHMCTFEKRNIDFSSVKEISVDFKVCHGKTPLSECKVIKCGIWLLHLQDTASTVSSVGNL